MVGRKDIFCEGGKGGKYLDRENEEKKKENLEVEIFGGEKKNVKGKGGIYFKREYSFLRRRRKGGEYLVEDICFA